MATLSDLRDYVRVQTETTVAELPSSTIDSYLREAFNRTISQETRWPFYEEVWTLTQEVGSTALSVPSTMNRMAIVSLIDDQNQGFRLTQVDYETAEDFYRDALNPGSSSLAHYSVWGDYIYLWPVQTFTTEYTYTVRGYRNPTDWIGSGPGTEVDADERLHYPLAQYAVALAYAQQEDEVLEDRYMTRWQNDVNAARRAIMEPARNAPLRMGGGRWRFAKGTGWGIS